MDIPRIVLGLTAAAFMAFGIAFALWPETMAALVEIQLASATAEIDFAATYGGFELGFGAFLLLALRRATWVEPGLWAGLLSLGGFAAVRLLSVLLSDSPVAPATYIALGLELSGVLLNLWGLRVLRRQHGRLV